MVERHPEIIYLIPRCKIHSGIYSPVRSLHHSAETPLYLVNNPIRRRIDHENSVVLLDSENIVLRADHDSYLVLIQRSLSVDIVLIPSI
jgi:hypothetical protein